VVVGRVGVGEKVEGDPQLLEGLEELGVPFADNLDRRATLILGRAW